MLTLTSLWPSRITRVDPPLHPALDLPTLMGRRSWSRLPHAVQRRFAPGHADATYAGHMDLRCSFIGHIYAALARLLGGPLTHINTHALPTSVRVHDNGCGGVVWERCFHTGAAGAGRGRMVRSTKEMGSDGRLLERTDGGLSMSLDLFEEAGVLVFRSRQYWLVLKLGPLGNIRVPVPSLLSPGTCRVEHADLGGGLFRFTLAMVHPLWGETFHQTGVFADPIQDIAATTTECTL